jgi:hypothetical protein
VEDCVGGVAEGVGGGVPGWVACASGHFETGLINLT